MHAHAKGGLYMINSNAFDYINVLDKAADASWKRQELISNNIANQDTPGYKRQDIRFETELQQALKFSKYTSVDDKVSNIKLSRLNGKQYTDATRWHCQKDINYPR